MLQKTMISIGGKIYALNLKKIFEFINYSDKNNSREKEITDAYEKNDEDGSLDCTSKVVREIITPANSQIDNIKYDFIKMLIGQLLTYEGGELPTETFGTVLALNTLISEELLVEINVNEE